MQLKKIIYLIIFSLFMISQLIAQSKPSQELHLKNGSIIKGSLVEVIPDSIVKFETSDGSIFIFSFDDIQEIKKISEYQNDVNSQFRNPWTVHRTISGWGLFSTWCATALGSAAMGDKMVATTVIPIVGPFITIMRIEDSPNTDYLPGGKELLIISGATQSAFAIYYVVSWIGQANYEPTYGLSIQPTFQNSGIRITYKF